jgi:hypothetical protein
MINTDLAIPPQRFWPRKPSALINFRLFPPELLIDLVQRMPSAGDLRDLPVEELGSRKKPVSSKPNNTQERNSGL